MNLPLISHGLNDLLFAVDGRRFIDLQSGFGSVLMGHANPQILRGIEQQIGRVWASSRLPTESQRLAESRVESFLPDDLGLAGFCSTGHEAAEFALRIASVITGRSRFLGFSRAMHGKTLATSALCWPNRPINLPGFQSLPFLDEASEDELLERLDQELADGTVAAVFVEPIHASSGGRSGSIGFHEELMRRCRRRDTLCVYDEILTGFHRTGSSLWIDGLVHTPDLLLIGKAMGNGFPVAAVALDRRFAVTAAMLPNSTFSGNPLASAAVAATLLEMQRIDPSGLVAGIEARVLAERECLAEYGIALRGRGALWLLALPSQLEAASLVERLADEGVLVSPGAGFLRLLPAATMEAEHLDQALMCLRKVCSRMLPRG